MLFLLESRPVVGEVAYERVRDMIIDAYWRNSEAHPHDYQPIVLINDIVRYWRILLLNYEARNTRQEGMSEATRDAKRRLRSYKLRFSRCLTCYSAIVYLLALTNGKDTPHVRKADIRLMVSQSPLERLLWARDRSERIGGAAALVDRLLEGYLTFLTFADQGTARLEEGFKRSPFRTQRSRDGRSFGESMFELTVLLGRRNPLFRWVVV
jgi:hypothetical protein